MPNTAEGTKKRTALGQGLDALLPVNEPAGSSDSLRGVTYLQVDSLVPNPEQPRRLFSESSLAELTASVKEMGVIQPLIVRPVALGRYEIVAGERRWRAACSAGSSTVPVIVRNLTDSESLEISLIENIQRENLNPIETAEAYETLLEKYCYTHEVLANRIGKDRSNITNYLRLLKLPDPIKEEVRLARISMGHARSLLAVDNVSLQLRLSSKVVRQKLSVREIEKIVSNYKEKRNADVKPATEKDPDLACLETGLSRLLSTKVSIRTKSNGSGKLEISYHSKDELDRLLETLGYVEDFS